MKRITAVFLLAAMLFCLFACAMDTPIPKSGLEYEEVCEWTKADWNKADDEEKVEALFLLIDVANEKVDAGTSAKASVEGFTEAFENASDKTTLKELFDTSTADEITYVEEVPEEK